MANSVTSITGFDMPESKRKSIEQFKHIWAPRGTAVHKALECYLLDKQIPEQPKYDDWVVPLLTHQYFQEFFKPLAVEYRVVDLKNSIGGTLDAYGIDTRTNKKVLMDLKTQSNPNANAYNTNEQLGAYYSMLSSNGIQVDECRLFGADQIKLLLVNIKTHSNAIQIGSTNLIYGKCIRRNFKWVQDKTIYSTISYFNLSFIIMELDKVFLLIKPAASIDVWRMYQRLNHLNFCGRQHTAL